MNARFSDSFFNPQEPTAVQRLLETATRIKIEVFTRAGGKPCAFVEIHSEIGSPFDDDDDDESEDADADTLTPPPDVFGFVGNLLAEFERVKGGGE